jgi:hypothetical protein
MTACRFSCALDASTESPLPHVWEHTIGSGHATLALRADWQSQLLRCRRELGFRHVRLHGILCDDMGTLVREEGALLYSFFNVDQICDFLLSIDMRPFVELSFMPTALASKDSTVFHYHGNITPPKDYEAWETLVRKLVHHWVERYGSSEVRRWFFEIWNEPNLPAFWTGSQTDYFRLYQHAARAIKDVDGALIVGGPATADNAWIGDFLEFCDGGAVPVDFVSTHHYPTDAFGKPGDDTVSQLAQSHRSVLRDEAAKVHAEARGKPLYYTEWSTSSNPFDPLHRDGGPPPRRGLQLLDVQRHLRRELLCVAPVPRRLWASHGRRRAQTFVSRLRASSPAGRPDPSSRWAPRDGGRVDHPQGSVRDHPRDQRRIASSSHPDRERGRGGSRSQADRVGLPRAYRRRPRECPACMVGDGTTRKATSTTGGRPRNRVRAGPRARGIPDGG